LFSAPFEVERKTFKKKLQITDEQRKSSVKIGHEIPLICFSFKKTDNILRSRIENRKVSKDACKIKFMLFALFLYNKSLF